MIRQPYFAIVQLATAVLLVACGDPVLSRGLWKPVAATKAYEGKTLAEWATEWGRWDNAQPSCVEPERDEDGSACAKFQPKDGPAVFLTGGNPVTRRTKCVVPADRAIVISLLAISADNAGVEEQDLKSEEELREISRLFLETITDVRLIVDGDEIPDLHAYMVEPTEYTYDLPPPPNRYSCTSAGPEGAVSPAFVGGMFVVMPPATPGRHVLEYSGSGRLEGEVFGNHVIDSFEVD